MTVDEALTLTDEIQKGRLSEGKDHYALVLAAYVLRCVAESKVNKG